MKKFLLLIRKENSVFANDMYINAIEYYGGKAILVNDNSSVEDCLEKLIDVSGILLPGGDEVGPLDYFLIEYAIDNKLKLLGICQGMQSMALFGSNDKLISIGNLNHKQPEGYVHTVKFTSSKIKKIYATDEIMVNSHHLQTVLQSYYFSVVGRSDDGLIEAIESSDEIFQVGVQWHPERMLDYDTSSKKLLCEFIK